MQSAGTQNIPRRIAGPLALVAALTLALAPGALAAAPTPKPTATPKSTLTAHRKLPEAGGLSRAHNTAGEDSRGLWAL
jgi:hypothetical protein